jgi:hypothetical protein
MEDSLRKFMPLRMATYFQRAHRVLKAIVSAILLA